LLHLTPPNGRPRDRPVEEKPPVPETPPNPT
jgi:hypothetical protein